MIGSFLTVFASLVVAIDPGSAGGVPAGEIRDKTLVAWVYPANLTQRGAGVLTVFEPADESFDAIVLGEKAPRRWMAGSDFFRRTPDGQEAWPEEKADPGTLIQVAISYRGRDVSIFRDGHLYAHHQVARPCVFEDRPSVLLGVRYLGRMGAIGHFAGDIEEARLYDVALDPSAVAALRPGEISGRRPLARWTFDDGTAADAMGTYPPGRLVGGARVVGGRLRLDGAGGHVVVDPPLPRSQWMFYRARARETGRTWDTWLFQDSGRYYLFTLAQSGPQWDNISMAVSSDGVHWTERGRILSKAEGVTWIGTGSTWRSPTHAREGAYLLNFSEWRGPRQTIFFAASDDLLHWKRLADTLEFRQDERWYERNGRWDCIYTIPRDGGGLYGYWTASPRSETGGRFGFGQSADGIRWEALPPPKVKEVGEGEVGAVERIAGRYYMLYGTGGKMVTLVADRPEGPFRAAKKNRVVLSGGTYFARFFPTTGGLLVNHHSIARDGQVFLAPLKRAQVDHEGTLRLAWWSGNHALEHAAITLSGPSGSPENPARPRRLGTRFDSHEGVVIEGTITRPTPADPSPRGLYLEHGDGSGTAILLDASGTSRIGRVAPDGTGYQPEESVNREVATTSVARFRLLLKGSLLEYYLDDLLIHCHSLPAKATGIVGVIGGRRPDAVQVTGAWR